MIDLNIINCHHYIFWQESVLVVICSHYLFYDGLRQFKMKFVIFFPDVEYNLKVAYCICRIQSEGCLLHLTFTMQMQQVELLALTNKKWKIKKVFVNEENTFN